MSTALERRMSKLEEAAMPDRDGITIIYRRIVCVEGGEAVRAVFGDTTVERLAGETEGGFMDRAGAEAIAATGRKPSRVILLPASAMNL